MVSFLHVDAFEAKLRSICEEEKFSISFIPPIFDIFQNEKTFYGTVKRGSFSLKKNSRLFRTSYFIEGTYSKDDNILYPSTFFAKRTW